MSAPYHEWEPGKQANVEIAPEHGWTCDESLILTASHLAGSRCVACNDPARTDGSWWHGGVLVRLGVITPRTPVRYPGQTEDEFNDQPRVGTVIYAHPGCVDVLEAVHGAGKLDRYMPTLFADRSPGHERGDLELVRLELEEALRSVWEVCEHYAPSDSLGDVLHHALKELAIDLGGIDRLTGHRPGSWEAALISQLAAGAADQLNED